MDSSHNIPTYLQLGETILHSPFANRIDLEESFVADEDTIYVNVVDYDKQVWPLR